MKVQITVAFPKILSFVSPFPAVSLFLHKFLFVLANVNINRWNMIMWIACDKNSAHSWHEIERLLKWKRWWKCYLCDIKWYKSMKKTFFLSRPTSYLEFPEFSTKFGIICQIRIGCMQSYLHKRVEFVKTIEFRHLYLIFLSFIQ